MVTLYPPRRRASTDGSSTSSPTTTVSANQSPSDASLGNTRAIVGPRRPATPPLDSTRRATASALSPGMFAVIEICWRERK